MEFVPDMMGYAEAEALLIFEITNNIYSQEAFINANEASFTILKNWVKEMDSLNGSIRIEFNEDGVVDLVFEADGNPEILATKINELKKLVKGNFLSSRLVYSSTNNRSCYQLVEEEDKHKDGC